MASRKEKVAKRYDRWAKWYDLFDLGGQNTQKTYSVDALDVQKGQEILDLGCGTGAILGHVAEATGNTGKVIAIDISPKMVEFVNERFKGKHEGVIIAQLGDAEALPFEEGRFPRILATFAITSFPGPLESLQEMYRVLQPGGTLSLLDTGPPVKGNISFHILKPVMRAIGHTHIDRDGISLAQQAGFTLKNVKRWKHSLVYCATFTK